MVSEIKLHTVNAKNNCIFEIYKEITQGKIDVNKQLLLLLQSLKNKLNNPVDYESLQYALVPTAKPKKNDICFVFSIDFSCSNNYAIKPLSLIIDKFDKASPHSILIGDFLPSTKNDYPITSLFREEVKVVNTNNYSTSQGYFCVYVNNLTRNKYEEIHDHLVRSYPLYFGYINMTFSSPLKDYLSFILSSLCVVKNHTVIFQSYDFEYTQGQIKKEEKKLIIIFRVFEASKYFFVAIPDHEYALLLTYRIESSIGNSQFDGGSIELGALGGTDASVLDLSIILPDEKFQYIQEKNNLYSKSKTDFLEMLKSKIASNYIYNLRVEENAAKFNIIMELPIGVTNSGELKRKLIAFKYLKDEKSISPITMY